MRALKDLYEKKILLFYLFWFIFYNFLPALFVNYNFSKTITNNAILYSILGLVSFLIGYLLNNIINQPTRAKTDNKNFLSNNYLSVFFITYAIFLAFGSVFMIIFSITAGYTAIKLINEKKIYKLIIVVLITIVSLILNFTRMYILIFILSIFSYLYFNTRKLYLIQILIFLTISLSTLILMREFRQYKYIDTAKVSEYYIQNAETTNIFKAIDTYHTYNIYLFIIDYFPDKKDYYYGSSLIKPFLFFIPREVWENKPTNITNEIPRLLYGNSRSSIYSSGLTIFGEFYVNFGIFGILILSFLFGALSKRVKILFFNGNNLQKLLALSYIVLFPSLLRGGISTTITTFIILLFYFKTLSLLKPIKIKI